jgi:hypothetical protein
LAETDSAQIPATAKTGKKIIHLDNCFMSIISLRDLKGFGIVSVEVNGPHDIDWNN